MGGQERTDLSVLRKISLKRDSPSGLYLRLNCRWQTSEQVFGAGGVCLAHLVEAVEGVLVGVHVERVDGQVVRGQIERLEHLAEREVLAVAVDDDLL